MKKWIGALFTILVPTVGYAVVQEPLPGWIWTYYGPTIGADWGPQALPTFNVPDNATLKLTPVGASPFAQRMTFSSTVPAFPLFYKSSTSPCSLNGGAGDDGSQVSANSGGCWIANFDGMKPNPQVWGAVGDGTANDAAAVQAAISAMQGKVLYTGPYLYKVNTGLTSAGKISIIGEHRRDTGGFRAGALNMDVLTVNIDDSEVRGVYFDMAAPGTNVSGTAIKTSNGTNVIIRENVFNQPCTAVDLSFGVGTQVFDNYLIDTAHAGCSGIIVGARSTSGNTIDPRIFRNIVNVKALDPVTNCFSIYDAGGISFRDNECVFGSTGVAIIPGANQQIQWGFFSGVLGDTNSVQGLLIAPGAATGVVKGVFFEQAWTASAVGGSGVVITNPNLGTVQGIHFNGHRSYSNSSDGFTLNGAGGTIKDVSIDASSICSNSAGAPNVRNGVTILTAVDGFAIRNSTIGNGCDNVSGGTQGTGVATGTAIGVMIENNDFRRSDGAGGAIAGAHTSYTARGNIGIRWDQGWGGAGTDVVSIANGAVPVLPKGSGIVTFNNTTNGDIGVFAIGGSNVTLIASTGATFVASGAPAAGKMGLSFNGTDYILTSNFGSTVLVGAQLNELRPSN